MRFADLTPVFADSDGLRVVIDALASAAPDADIVAGIDARGFLLGAGVAIALGRGIVAVRKGGKLPPPVRSRSYQLEYGSATLEVPAEGIDLAGKRVLLVDDVLATGGTAVAAAELMRRRRRARRRRCGGAGVDRAARSGADCRLSADRPGEGVRTKVGAGGVDLVTAL